MSRLPQLLVRRIVVLVPLLLLISLGIFTLLKLGAGRAGTGAARVEAGQPGDAGRDPRSLPP